MMKKIILTAIILMVVGSFFIVDLLRESAEETVHDSIDIVITENKTEIAGDEAEELASLHGTVCDEKTQKGIEGAVVQVGVVNEKMYWEVTPRGGYAGESIPSFQEIATASTDQKGFFKIEGLQPGRAYKKIVTSDGYVTINEFTEGLAAGGNKRAFKMWASVKNIALSFKRKSGEPLANHSVALIYESKKNTFSSKGSGTTDEKGKITFEEIVKGKTWVKVMNDALSSKVFVNYFEVDMVEEGASYAFVARDEPVLSIKVGLENEERPSIRQRVQLICFGMDAAVSDHVRTDEKGACQFIGIPPGKAYLSIDRKAKYCGHGSYPIEIPTKGSLNKAFILKRERTSTDLSIEMGAIAEIFPEGQGTMILFNGGVFVEEQEFPISDTFMLKGVSPGKYYVEVKVGNQWWHSSSVVLKKNELKTAVLSSVPEQEIQGFVFDKENRPVPEAEVSRIIRHSELKGYPVVQTDKNGFFTLHFPKNEPLGYLVIWKFGECKKVALKTFKNGNAINLKRYMAE